MDSSPLQVFIRDEKGKIWGPLELSTVSLLLENGRVEGRVEVSRDGVSFALPGKLPDIRDAFPRELWGDGVTTGMSSTAADLEEAPSEILLGGDLPPAPAPRPMVGTAPIAGPGAVAAASHREARSHAPPPVAARQPSPGAPKLTPPTAPVTASKATDPVPAEGDIAQVSPLHLYYLAASTDQTGLLTLALSDRTIEVHFRKGNPEYVGSSHLEDSVGGFLLQQGLASADQIGKADAAKDRFGGELIGALFGLGTLNPGSAFAQLAQRALGLLMKGLVAESGTFRFEHQDLAPHRAMPLGNKWGVIGDVVRRIPSADLRRRLQAVADLPVMKSGGRIQATDVRLTPQEARAATFIDGVRSLSQLWHDYPQEADVFARVVFLLDKLELVSFAAVPVRAAPTPVPPPTPVSPRPITSPQPAPKPVAPVPKVAAVEKPVAPVAPVVPVSPEQELAELRAFAGKLKTQNHFELLGLTEKADAGAIKIAYFKLAKVYHPDTVPQGAAPELQQLKSDVFGAIGQAYRTLSDDKARAIYVDELKHGSEKIDVAQILLAEDLFQRGSIMVKARKFPEALKALDDAIKANADEPEFYAWRGFAKFFQTPDKAVGKAEALKDLNYCLKKNERVAPAHYFLGQISKLTGDNASALKHFKRATELNPDYTDAQRELRMLAVKK